MAEWWLPGAEGRVNSEVLVKGYKDSGIQDE